MMMALSIVMMSNVFGIISILIMIVMLVFCKSSTWQAHDMGMDTSSITPQQRHVFKKAINGLPGPLLLISSNDDLP